jgi:hypothetical protein
VRFGFCTSAFLPTTPQPNTKTPPIWGSHAVKKKCAETPNLVWKCLRQGEMEKNAFVPLISGPTDFLLFGGHIVRQFTAQARTNAF